MGGRRRGARPDYGVEHYAGGALFAAAVLYLAGFFLGGWMGWW